MRPGLNLDPLFYYFKPRTCKPAIRDYGPTVLRKGTAWFLAGLELCVLCTGGPLCKTVVLAETAIVSAENMASPQHRQPKHEPIHR